MFFSICSDRVALDRRSSVQDSTNICLEHPQSWSPKNLTVCSRLIQVLPPALKIEDLLYISIENSESSILASPQVHTKAVKMSTTFSPWPNAGSASAHPQFDSDNVHSRFGSEIQQIINLGKRNSFLLHVLAQLHFHVNSSVVQNFMYMPVQSVCNICCKATIPCVCVACLTWFNHRQ